MAKGTLILGVGNLLLSDEGVGVHVARRLQAATLPEDVEVLDGGTTGYELMDVVCGRDRLVVVDCLGAPEPPGTIVRASPDELELDWPAVCSAHQTGLRELFQGIRRNCPEMEVVVIGIVPEKAGVPGMELSETIARRLSRLESLVLETAVMRSGESAVRRSTS